MNLRKRLPTALVLLTLVFAAIHFLPRLGYFLVLQVLILLSLLEFYSLLRKKRLFPPHTLGVAFMLLIGISFYWDKLPLELALFAGLLVFAVYFVVSIRTVEAIKPFPAAIALTFFGALYLGLTLNFFLPLRDVYGTLAIYFFLTVIFIGDTGAYFFGKAFGRHKMAPMASPRKTWEGSFGGIVTACLGGLAVRVVLLPALPLWKAVLFAFLVHAAAQVSDPLESLFKRAAGVKDSSNMLPGHGGFLDRIDSLILAAPLFYFLLKYVGMD